MRSRELLQNTYGFLKKSIVPELRYSQSIYEDVLNSGVPAGSVWLDVGCGHHLLPPWRPEQEEQLFARASMVVGMDYEHSRLKSRCHRACVDPAPNAELASAFQNELDRYS